MFLVIGDFALPADELVAPGAEVLDRLSLVNRTEYLLVVTETAVMVTSGDLLKCQHPVASGDFGTAVGSRTNFTKVVSALYAARDGLHRLVDIRAVLTVLETGLVAGSQLT